MSEHIEKKSGSLFQNKKNETITFVEDDSKWSLDEIILDDSIKETIEDVISFCDNKDLIINDWGLNKFLKGNNSIGINLYGEPGTGKSITADAIAKALHRKKISVDYSQIRDSKVGGTEKNLSALFEQAEKNGSIIVLDEADGLLEKRSTDSNNPNSENDVKAHLLSLIDRSNVIVIYTTNLFQNFDRAFFRRILYHINFPLPNTEQRKALWQFHMGEEKIPKSPDFSYDLIADNSVGLSGGDIKNITLKVCVKVAAKRVPVITNALVEEEITRYRMSLKDHQNEKE